MGGGADYHQAVVHLEFWCFFGGYVFRSMKPSKPQKLLKSLGNPRVSKGVPGV